MVGRGETEHVEMAEVAIAKPLFATARTRGQDHARDGPIGLVRKIKGMKVLVETELEAKMTEGSKVNQRGDETILKPHQTYRFVEANLDK